MALRDILMRAELAGLTTGSILGSGGQKASSAGRNWPGAGAPPPFPPFAGKTENKLLGER